MLVVAPQPYLWPRTYFAGTPPSGDGLPHYAVHVKPRAEKQLSRLLQADGVPHFVPTVVTRHTYAGNRVRTHDVPLFTGYLFVLGRPLNREPLFRGNQIIRFIPVPRPEELFEDLQNVWLTLTRRPTAVREEIYRPGRKVEVISGPLKGVIGELVRTHHDCDRLVIRVRLFDRAVSVDIDVAHVRPI
jgi:hypothetical protein